MGSIKTDKRTGRSFHWTDALRKYVPPWHLPRNPKEQIKSLDGQLALFSDVPLEHLKAKKK